MLLGHLINTVTVGCGSWSLPSGSSRIPRITDWSITKYLKAWTASAVVILSPAQELHCMSRLDSSRRVERLSAPQALGKYPTCSRTTERRCSAASLTLLEAGLSSLSSFSSGTSEALFWDFVPEMPSSATSRTVGRHSLSPRR